MRNQRYRRNPCLTMHQPWASLLVYGIKRIEGRSWPSPLTGTLWIHAAGKVPDAATIKAMEGFYREIYAVDGVTDIKFPEDYPTSRLLERDNGGVVIEGAIVGRVTVGTVCIVIEHRGAVTVAVTISIVGVIVMIGAAVGEGEERRWNIGGPRPSPLSI
ncbi:hypothetical protein GIB67_032411 [Kingdonia uniflora]|uniref:ASCH domain-containing protein n=1 Tax=Kingdonia uniflora TaxID=39325 RepID=A0A7J7MIR0_9MAGN|nr:hypothetical protein GIB67_032411 [Kingdonia uniflora]